MVSKIVFLILFDAIINLEAKALTAKMSNLHYLVTQKYFVDKTNIVKEFFKYNHTVVISAPRRFGKSANMDAVRKFCEIIVENGTIVPSKLTKNYELFKRHNLNIFKDKKFFDKHFGKYPVINIDFKTINFNNFQSFLRKFLLIIRYTFETHMHLLRSKKLNEEQKELYYTFLNKTTNFGRVKLVSSIAELSRLMSIHFNKSKVVILIDGLDIVVNNLLTKNYKSPVAVLKHITEFLFEFMNVSLKSNVYLERSLVNTCIMPGPIEYEKEDNITYIPFANNHINCSFYPYYGFSENEMKTMLPKYNMSDKLDDLRKWYAGYKKIPPLITTYNPSSIVAYLELKKLKNYYVGTVDMKRFKVLFVKKNLQAKLYDILHRNSTIIKYELRLDRKELVRLHKIIISPEQYKIRLYDVNLFLQIMTDQGFFNIACFYSDTEVIIDVPNEEIRQSLYKLINKNKRKKKH